MTGQNMKGVGKMINRTAMGHFITRMGMSIKVIGKIIELTGKEYILVLMEEGMKDIGLMMFKMVLELKNGKMVVLIKVTMIWVKKKDMETICRAISIKKTLRKGLNRSISWNASS